MKKFIIFNEGLKQFRICHDLCGIFSPLIGNGTERLDQSAANFRQLSKNLALLSEKIASVWCPTCSAFYSSIAKLSDDPQEILVLLSGQAKDFEKGFWVLQLQAKNLIELFHSVGTTAVSEDLVKCFNKAMDEVEQEILELESFITQPQVTHDTFHKDSCDAENDDNDKNLQINDPEIDA